MSKGEILQKKKVAVLIETEYIPEEIRFYQDFFQRHGAQVDFLTMLLGEKKRTLVSDVTVPGEMPETMEVHKDIKEAIVEEYSIVLCAANYVACRLREIPPMGSLGSPEALQTPVAVQFMKRAMKNPNIVKGMLCHALWILTPIPEMLKGRKVICHTVVLADIVNAGADFVADESHVVIDRDLVTGRSAADLEAYGEALIEAYNKIGA